MVVRADLIRHADGRQYLREGECDGCVGRKPAQCCTFVALPLARHLSADEQRWLELHPGLITDGDNIVINIACSALVDNRCALFDQPERPAMCQRFPELPGQVLDGCAYTLTEIPKGY